MVLKEETLSVTFLIRNGVFKLKSHSSAVGCSFEVGRNGALETFPGCVTSHLGFLTCICRLH